jgi:hypothetical protein
VMSKLLVDEISDADNTGPVTVTDGLNVSSGNVGVGTTSPNSPLEVSNGTENHRVAFNTGEVYLMARNASSYITQKYIANQHVFTGYGDNSSNEAARIDSSGNLLVGKTSAAYNTDGFEAHPNGETYVSRSGTPMAINRNSSDGTLLNFYKDGTTVGSIGTEGGYTKIIGGNGSVGSGLGFFNLAVNPRNAAGSLADGTISLGEGSNRFKDLYLSGGVYLGGTGAANKLDDYEEGTSIVGISAAAGSGGTISGGSLTWTKIGNQVIVAGNFSISSLGTLSGAFNVTGFPFAASSSFFQSQGAVRSQGIGGSNDIPVVIEMESGTSIARMHFSSGTSGQLIVQTSDLSVGDFLAFGLTYQI